MAHFQKAVSGNAYKNNGGTVIVGGSATTRTDVNVASFSQIRGFNSKIEAGPKLVANYTSKGVSGNVFSYIAAGEYQIINSSTKIGGASSSVIKFAGQEYQRISIARIESRRSTDILTIGLAYRTGRPISALSVSNDSFGSDSAARPSRALPGELTFMRGSPTPYSTTYAARTGS